MPGRFLSRTRRRLPMIMTPQSTISAEQPITEHHAYALAMRGVWEGNKANSGNNTMPLVETCQALRKPSAALKDPSRAADFLSPPPARFLSDRVGSAMGYVGKQGVEALHKYKYSGVDRSYMAKYVLQPFWTRFVKLFPLWMPCVGTVPSCFYNSLSHLHAFGVSSEGGGAVSLLPLSESSHLHF